MAFARIYAQPDLTPKKIVKLLLDENINKLAFESILQKIEKSPDIVKAVRKVISQETEKEKERLADIKVFLENVLKPFQIDHPNNFALRFGIAAYGSLIKEMQLKADKLLALTTYFERNEHHVESSATLQHK